MAGEGGGRPAQLNATNEIAVAAFLDGRIGFLDIADIAARALDDWSPATPAGLDDIYAIDARARALAAELTGLVADA